MMHTVLAVVGAWVALSLLLAVPIAKTVKRRVR